MESVISEQWDPNSIVLILTTIGLVIDKIITSYFTNRKLSMIEAHVNSQKTADTAKIQGMENEIKILKETASENNKVAALLAQRVATRARETDTKDPKVMEDIRDNTKETVDAVKDLKS